MSGHAGLQYNRAVGQALLTGQVAPPAQRYSLRADLAAWQAALRGLRHNPLLTHLRLAERRRLRRTPLWRRSLPLVIIPAIAGALVLLLLYLDMGMSGQTWTYLLETLIKLGSVLCFLLWFMQGVFQAVLGALGVLGRWHKRPSHLVLDDFASLTNLTDHEIVAGAIASLLPVLALRIAVGYAIFVSLPAVELCAMSYGLQIVVGPYQLLDVYDRTNLLDLIVTSTGAQLPLGLLAFGLSLPAMLALCMWFICLGRSINVEKIGILSASIIALSQAAYPIAYLNIINNDPFWYSARFYEGTPLERNAVWMLLVALSPAFLGYLLGLARRLPWVRVTLAILSPLVLGAMLLAVPFFVYGMADAVLGDHFYTYFSAVPTAVALAAGTMALLAPLTIVYSSWAQQDYQLVLGSIVSFLLLVPAQLCILYILSRFTIEAVGARRRRGE